MTEPAPEQLQLDPKLMEAQLHQTILRLHEQAYESAVREAGLRAAVQQLSQHIEELHAQLPQAGGETP